MYSSGARYKYSLPSHLKNLAVICMHHGRKLICKVVASEFITLSPSRSKKKEKDVGFDYSSSDVLAIKTLLRLITKPIWCVNACVWICVAGWRHLDDRVAWVESGLAGRDGVHGSTQLAHLPQHAQSENEGAIRLSQHWQGHEGGKTMLPSPLCGC